MLKDWNEIREKGLPPVGVPLIVTIKDNLQGMPNQLRYPVYFVHPIFLMDFAISSLVIFLIFSKFVISSHPF